jgi:hypothetical protein
MPAPPWSGASGTCSPTAPPACHPSGVPGPPPTAGAPALPALPGRAERVAASSVRT